MKSIPRRYIVEQKSERGSEGATGEDPARRLGVRAVRPPVGTPRPGGGARGAARLPEVQVPLLESTQEGEGRGQVGWEGAFGSNKAWRQRESNPSGVAYKFRAGKPAAPMGWASGGWAANPAPRGPRPLKRLFVSPVAPLCGFLIPVGHDAFAVVTLSHPDVLSPQPFKSRPDGVRGVFGLWEPAALIQGFDHPANRVAPPLVHLQDLQYGIGTGRPFRDPDFPVPVGGRGLVSKFWEPPEEPLDDEGGGLALGPGARYLYPRFHTVPIALLQQPTGLVKIHTTRVYTPVGGRPTYGATALSCGADPLFRCKAARQRGDR